MEDLSKLIKQRQILKCCFKFMKDVANERISYYRDKLNKLRLQTYTKNFMKKRLNDKFRKAETKLDEAGKEKSKGLMAAHSNKLRHIFSFMATNTIDMNTVKSEKLLKPFCFKTLTIL